MSFSSNVKAELTRPPIGRTCCAVAEAYGILLYCNTFSASEVRVVTESRELSRRLGLLFKKAFNLEFDKVQGLESDGGKVNFFITSPEKRNMIADALGIEGERTVAHRINFGLLEEECCRTAFVRGAFLAGGSVTDPEKRYHLELATSHFHVSRGMSVLLLDMGFSPKDVIRKGNYVTYFKQSDAIEDFLTKMGAPVSAMQVMNAKVEKDMRNAVQRQVNCDTANVEKAVEAAQGQISAIRKLERDVGLESLPDKLQETALLRIFNPEASLAELASLSNPPVSKSCINYRLKKLVQLAGIH